MQSELVYWLAGAMTIAKNYNFVKLFQKHHG